MSVVFPAPFSPTSATISPARTANDTSSTARVSPKDLVMCESESTFSVHPARRRGGSGAPALLVRSCAAGAPVVPRLRAG
jgi:hypothetical protein